LSYADCKARLQWNERCPPRAGYGSKSKQLAEYAFCKALNRNGADEWLWKQLSINEGEAIQGLAGVEAEGCGGEPVIRGEQPHNHCCCTSAVNVCYFVSYIYPSACSELLCF